MSYPFDPTGLLSSNLITNEQQILTPSNGVDFHLVVPDLGPYFQDSLVITIKDPSNNVKTLVEGIDYQCTHWFISASRACAKAVYGSINILDLTLSGIVTLQYQTIGGTWVLDTNSILQVLADTLHNPRITAWEEVTNYPVAFPPTPHQWNLADMVGMSNVVNAIAGIETAILQQISGVAAALSLKINTYTPAQIDAAIAIEVTNRSAAITALSTTVNAEIAAEIAARLADDTTINAAIAAEVAARMSAIASDLANTATSIATEATRATTSENTITTNLSAEVSRAETAEGTLASAISTVNTALGAEVSRAEAAEGTNATAIAALNTALNNEITARGVSEAAILLAISNIIPNNEDEAYFMGQSAS